MSLLQEQDDVLCVRDVEEELFAKLVEELGEGEIHARLWMEMKGLNEKLDRLSEAKESQHGFTIRSAYGELAEGIAKMQIWLKAAAEATNEAAIADYRTAELRRLLRLVDIKEPYFEFGEEESEE